MAHNFLRKPDHPPLQISSTVESLMIHGWEMLHNAAIYSYVYGEVNLFQGLPYYKKRGHAVIMGYSVEKSSIPISGRILGLAEKLLLDPSFHLETLEYWGAAAPPDLSNDLRCIERREPDQFNRDVVLDLTRLSSEQLYSLRFVRRALKNNLFVRINTQRVTGSHHHDLVEKFKRHHPSLDSDALNYVDEWTNVLKTDTVLLEIYKDARLVGFVVLSLFFRKMPTYAYGFFDNDILGTSDLGHAAMINYCIKNGYGCLDLGYSVCDSLLRYKTKWGQTIFIDPPWNVIWRKRNTQK